MINKSTTFNFRDGSNEYGAGAIASYIKEKELTPGKLFFSNDGLPESAPYNTLIYDPTTAQLYIGRGKKYTPQEVSNIRTVDSLDNLPKTGLPGIIYIGLQECIAAVWDSESCKYKKIVSNEGSSAENSPIKLYATIENFPDKGDKNAIYLTPEGRGYWYDPIANQYKVIFGDEADAFSKTESDARYARAKDTYTKTESNNLFAPRSLVYTREEAERTFAKDGISYTKDESDARYITNKKANETYVSYSDFEKLSDDNTKAINNQISQKVSELEEKINEKPGETADIKEIDKKLDKLAADTNTKINDSIQNTDAKIEERIAALESKINDSIDKKTSDIGKTLEDRIARLEEKIGTMTTENSVASTKTVKLANSVTCSAGQVLGYKAGGYVIADTKDSNSVRYVVLAIENSSNGTVKVLTQGEYALSSYDDGATLYVGENGTIVSSMPKMENASIKIVGISLGEKIMFDPDSTVVQIFGE